MSIFQVLATFLRITGHIYTYYILAQCLFQIDGQTALFIAVLANKPEIVHRLLEVPDINVNAVCSLQRQDGAQFEWSIVHEVCRLVQMMSTMIIFSTFDMNQQAWFHMY